MSDKILSKNTYRAYKSTNDRFVQYLLDTKQDQSEESAYHFLFFLRRSGKNDATIGRNRSALKTLFGYDLSDFGLSISKDSPSIPVGFDKIKEYLAKFESSDNLVDRRDWLVIALLYWGGLRRSEVANIKIEHINEDDNSIYLPITKAQEPQSITIDPILIDKMINYRIDLNKNGYRGTNVFLSFSRNNSGGKPLTDQSINLIVKRRLGPDAKAVYLRHGCITDLVNNGANPQTVQIHARHKSMGTTLMTYYHPPTEKENPMNFLPATVDKSE
jgi:integrase